MPAQLSQYATAGPPGYAGPYGQPASYGNDGPWSQAPFKQRAWRQLGGIGIATEILLGISALTSFAAIFISGASGLADLALLPTGILCLIWFWRARVNAEQTGWRQPLSTAWAFWGWVVPVIFLWFPCTIMAGIWRASQPHGDRGRPMALVGAWWACWLLAWFTGFRAVTRTVSGFVTHSYGFWFEDSTISKGFAALAAILFAIIIGQVSSGRLGAPTRPDWS